MGTNDTGATDADPTGNHTAGNNMVEVSSATYDADGNQLTSTSYADASTSYTTTYQYDWRNRQTDVLTPADVLTHYDYDNKGEVLSTKTYGSDDFTPSASDLRAERTTFMTPWAVSMSPTSITLIRPTAR